MFTKRTDLAMEARELWNESADKKTELQGVIAREYDKNGCKVTHVQITDENGAKALNKPIGNYVTVEITPFFRREENGFVNAVEAVASELSDMLGIKDGQTALIVGLGNRSITPDSIGPKTVSQVMVTRHLVEKLPESFGSMRQVAAMTPGVLGTTGVESSEIIRGVMERVRPDLLIVIDALASRNLSRLCKTIQLSDTGISPGSGVGNQRSAISHDVFGIPVIAMGVPTVVDAATLTADLLEQAGQTDFDPSRFMPFGGDMIVTPKDIDAQSVDAAKVVGYAINRVMHNDLSIEEIAGFLS